MMDVARTIAALGEAVLLPIASLRLDAENPRLPEGLQGQHQDDLAVDMALGFDAITVAESIASHGYFVSEPLIAIPSEDEADVYVVVEGNRRLAALLGLTRSDIRAQFADADRWEALAVRAAIDPSITVPVVLAIDRKSVTPIIGFRHISGILQWQPYAQARYISKLVDDDRLDYATVAAMVGIDRTKVGNLYRDQAIATQAKRLGIDTGSVERSFSLLTVAMSSPKLRAHIGAPLGSQTVPGVDPIPTSMLGNLGEMVTWVFGEGSTQPVIRDSREITKLGNVVASDIGLRALRQGESLEQAVQRIKDAEDDPEDRLVKRLRAGRNSLLAALDDIADYTESPEVRSLVDDARAAVEGLQAAIGDE
jgi:hypothetical protein